MALVCTVDFITPPVDDPFIFGQIAAANSISDIYAMGAKPLTCLNLMSFPSKKLEQGILHDIMRGALSKIEEAGAVLLGGHTIEDEEPKFGLAVNGIVHPEKYWSNATARIGDVVLITKPLGSGVLFNANLKGWVSREAIQGCIDIISTLNKKAMEILLQYSISAATDVTGFGLTGHAFEMAKGADTTFEIDLSALPIMSESLEMYKKGMNTGSNLFNKQLVFQTMRIEGDIPHWHEQILYDPQTNGGLLVALPEEEAERALSELKNNGVPEAAIIGKVIEKSGEDFLVVK